MAFPQECVGQEQLQAYLLGDLPEAQSREVALHLENCPVCEAEASRLDGIADPLMLSMQRALIAKQPGPSEGRTWPDTLDDQRFQAETALGVSLPSVAGFEVLGVLGRGGMSVVYKARQSRPARLVALKMILAGAHAGPEERSRFLVEADAIARLQHPNIVGVFEVGFADEMPFLSMELVTGGNLAQKLGGTPQPPRQAAVLLETLARAAHYAHQHGVIHRDIKPGNILLSFSRDAESSERSAPSCKRDALRSEDSASRLNEHLADPAILDIAKPWIVGAPLSAHSSLAPFVWPR